MTSSITSLTEFRTQPECANLTINNSRVSQCFEPIIRVATIENAQEGLTLRTNRFQVYVPFKQEQSLTYSTVQINHIFRAMRESVEHLRAFLNQRVVEPQELLSKSLRCYVFLITGHIIETLHEREAEESRVREELLHLNRQIVVTANNLNESQRALNTINETLSGLVEKRSSMEELLRNQRRQKEEAEEEKSKLEKELTVVKIATFLFNPVLGLLTQKIGGWDTKIKRCEVEIRQLSESMRDMEKKLSENHTRNYQLSSEIHFHEIQRTELTNRSREFDENLRNLGVSLTNMRNIMVVWQRAFEETETLDRRLTFYERMRHYDFLNERALSSFNNQIVTVRDSITN